MDGTKRGFTLVEILIAIAILGVLSAASFVAINPSERFKQSRDTERVADISNLNTLISQKRYSHVRRDLGDVQVVYISLPDTSATCSSYTLPTLPSGWTYACVTQENVLNVDGTGWLPVDISESRAMSALPLDPLNTQDYFYAYTIDSNEAFVLTAALESEEKLKGTAITDGGNDDIRFEKGTNLALWDEVSGLGGYWAFNEGEGVSTQDRSYHKRNGTLYNDPQWVSGVNGNALSFNGTSSYVGVGPNTEIDNEFTYIAWVYYINPEGGYGGIANTINGYGSQRNRILLDNSNRIYFQAITSQGSFDFFFIFEGQYKNTWRQYALVYDGSYLTAYVDGEQVDSPKSLAGPLLNGSSESTIGWGSGTIYHLEGYIDEVRSYSRALSGNEIKSHYKAIK